MRGTVGVLWELPYTEYIVGDICIMLVVVMLLGDEMGCELWELFAGHTMVDLWQQIMHTSRYPLYSPTLQGRILVNWSEIIQYTCLYMYMS